MNTLPSSKKKTSMPYKFYLLVVFILTLSMVFYVFPDSLDITRYYEMAETAVWQYGSVIDYAEYWYETHFDFIYPASLFLAVKMGLSMDIITVLYMSLYYICVFEILRKNFPNLRIPGYILLYGIMFAPFIWIQSISRNLASIAFFYLAVSFILEGKKFKSVACLIISLFTHVSILMYIPLIFIAYFLEKRDVNNKLIGLSIIVALVFSFLAPSQLLDLISFVLDGSDMRYADDYGQLQAQGALQNSYIGYGDKLPIVFCLLYSVLLLFINNRKDFMYWMLYILTLMLAFFVFSSLMFTNRVIMLMTLFVVFNAYNVIRYGSTNKIKILKTFSIIGCFVVLMHFYAYRMYFSI